jgi:branched-chain amino acid aminotransferase
LLARPSTEEKFVYGETTGECTLKLQSALRDIMRGKMEDRFGWVDVVKEDDLLLPKEEKAEDSVLSGVNAELPVMIDDVHERSGAVVSAPVEVQVEA